MEEIWKDVKGYEGLYQVSNLGRVKSFRHWQRDSKSNERILHPSITNNGYGNVTLYRSSSDRRKFLVHRLVAEAFVDNPNNYEAINHIAEDKLNNRSDNLEWCTLSYNNAYGTAKIRASITKGNRIQQLTINGDLIATYESLYIVSMITGIPKHAIVDCCAGHCKTSYGYIWRYA